MFEKVVKATVAGVGEESTQTLVLLFAIWLLLWLSTATAPAKVSSDLLAVKSNGCFSFFILLGLFPSLNTPSNMKLLP